MKLGDLEKVNGWIDIADPDPADLKMISDALQSGPVLSGAERRKAQAATFGYGTDRIFQAVVHHAKTYRGSFDFMVKMRAISRETGTLTKAQAAGVLNCMIADALRTLRRRGDL